MGQWRFWGFAIILNLVQCQKVTFLNTCSSINLFRAKNTPLHLKSRKNAYILWCVCNGALRCNIRIGFVSSVGRAHRGSKRKWWGPWFFFLPRPSRPRAPRTCCCVGRPLCEDFDVVRSSSSLRLRLRGFSLQPPSFFFEAAASEVRLHAAF